MEAEARRMQTSMNSFDNVRQGGATMQGRRLAAWFGCAGTLLLASAALPVAAQTEHPLTGRKIASVMGVSGADWLERPERELEENPSRAIELLDFKPGMSVADIGAGSGYYAIRIARKVGSTGKVYAVDIQPGMLARLKRRLIRDKITNVEPVMGGETDPHLPDAQLDVILMVDVYHEFSRPQEMLQSFKRALKPTGKLILLEFRKEDASIPIRAEHKMSVWEVKTELEAEGYHIDQVIKDLPWQNIFILSVVKPN